MLAQPCLNGIPRSQHPPGLLEDGFSEWRGAVLVTPGQESPPRENSASLPFDSSFQPHKSFLFEQCSKFSKKSAAPLHDVPPAAHIPGPRVDPATTIEQQDATTFGLGSIGLRRGRGPEPLPHDTTTHDAAPNPPILATTPPESATETPSQDQVGAIRHDQRYSTSYGRTLPHSCNRDGRSRPFNGERTSEQHTRNS